MSTLVIRLVDGSNVEYTHKPCANYVNSVEPYQWWPEADLKSSIIQNNHLVADYYQPRLMKVPYSVRGPSLEYISVSVCFTYSSFDEIKSCLNNYHQETDLGLEGVTQMGWEAFAYMNHKTDGMLSSDSDQVYILKNDRGNSNRRKCIISFAGSNTFNGDFTNFLMGGKDETSYCGRGGVHSGMSNELSRITHDPQYANDIVPALETCYHVTCVGHSLGGALCNLFTMCANQGLENLDESDDAENWDDYTSLIWTKKEG